MAALTPLLTLVRSDPDERFFHEGTTMGTKGTNSFIPWQRRIPQEGRLSELCEIVEFLSRSALVLIPRLSPRTEWGVLFPGHGLPKGTSEEQTSAHGSPALFWHSIFNPLKSWTQFLPKHFLVLQLLEW